MPPELDLNPGRFYTPTPEELTARKEADLKNAELLKRPMGDTGDDFRELGHTDETVVADLREQQNLAKEGAVPF